MEGKIVSAAAALKHYFGLKDGQTLADFTQELKALSPEEKFELATAACMELGFNLK